MQLPQPTHAKYSGFLTDIKRGQIKIPQFQREFVWSIQKSAALVDSIVKGYPVGTFIFWMTKERLRHVRNIGSESLPPPKEGTPLPTSSMASNGSPPSMRHSRVFPSRGNWSD